ncbi:hypothetical protein [Bradyrhizobium cenepequi]|uniref:hypothetical protein n=1 Tax=Bradyrhizobium cenepequi TaxID=2821403 RepID=UPI001CE274FD|nr:hypothetical protein [Bradyrhizobium cenepequi]MCA6108663.1 hypothetical protein [Bradyrhizobium cenepequi]
MRRGRKQVGERMKGMFVPAPAVGVEHEDGFRREKSRKLNSGWNRRGTKRFLDEDEEDDPEASFRGWP